MLKSTQRTIYYYDLVVTQRAVHARTPAIDDLVNVWKAAFDADNFCHKRERGKVIYRIGDMAIDTTKGVIRFLVRRTDITASDAVYSNMTNGVIRYVPKQDDEGGDTAAHFVISLLPEKDKPNTYLCMLEGVQAISHRLIQPMFNHVISKACKNDKAIFQYDDAVGAKHRDGSDVKHSFIPHIELRGHLSDDVVKDLESGIVSRVELIESKGFDQLGGDPYLKEEQYSLRVKVEKNLPSDGRFQRLWNAMQTKKEIFQTGRIIFRDKQDRTRSIEYDLNTGTPEQQTYIKCYTINNINPPMAQSTDHLVPTFVSEIENQVIAERNC